MFLRLLTHGLLFCLDAFLIWNEKKWMGKKKNEIFAIIFNGRYVVFFSCFAIYCGAIYNEFFAVSMDIWGTRWNLTHADVPAYTYNSDKYKYPYPFGVDPSWKDSDNELLFYNSLKMKMSVIIGVIQMSVGIFLKLLNGIHYGHQLDIWFEFLPQLIFLWATFGYLCFLVFAKWTLAVDNSPLILIVLINMFIPTGGAAANSTVMRYVYNANVEAPVETVLVVVALICIPWMLVPKPIFLNFMFKKRKERQEQGIVDDSSFEGHTVEEFKMGEIIVHQILETIEFVLGTLSHTASYLRLWALSLAHSELATVFWAMLFSPAMSAGVVLLNSPVVSGIGAFLGFGVWFAITIGVILMMESLSAFLHALRLHWVEFQSKFYKGDGVKFLPLNFPKHLAVYRVDAADRHDDE